MRFKVLVDNISSEELKSEWGLSIYIEYSDKKIILDTGWTGIFKENAGTLGVDLSKIDFGVLSHAHYDHADGLETFFEANSAAKFFLQAGTKENCYRKMEPKNKYIGIKPGTLSKYSDRFEYVFGKTEICPGVFLLPHSTKGLRKVGKASDMLVKKGPFFVPDSFKHEQSLVLDTAKGLVIFNSCSHAGADNIINEVSKAFPDKSIYAMVGGFHLFEKTDEEVAAFSDRVEKTGIEHIVTGHCTGDRAFEILKERLGDKVEQLHVGLEISI